MSYGIPAAEPSAQVPVCPRHPDRPSYVRCQRCGRPACPDCQRAAAVGFQCVDCVNETRRTTPEVRTVYGGAVATGKPLVTFSLIAACAVLFVLQWIVPGRCRVQELRLRFGLRRSGVRSLRTVAPADIGLPAFTGLHPPHCAEHVHAVDVRPGAGAPPRPAAFPGRVPRFRHWRFGRLPASSPRSSRRADP